MSSMWFLIMRNCCVYGYFACNYDIIRSINNNAPNNIISPADAPNLVLGRCQWFLGGYL